MALNADSGPRISVVTPSYNQAEFLEASLRSVIDQGFPDLEYVVIDGGSTDGSIDIIRRHEADLLYWVSEPDCGHAHALNKGFGRTTGDIMCWINSSDMYYPWTFSTVAEIFSQLPEVEWIMGVPSQFDRDGQPRLVGSVHGINVYDILAGDYRWIQQESVFWRRSLWERAGGRLDQTLRCAADFELWLRFFRSASLYGVGTTLGGFRVHDDQLSEAGDGQYEREAADVHARFVSSWDRLTRTRGGLVRYLDTGKPRLLPELLHRAGVLPWYTHPAITFDFEAGAWSIR